MTLLGALLGAHEEQLLAFGVGTEEFGDNPVARCEWAALKFTLAIQVVEVQVVIARPFVLPDELVVAVGQEVEGILGFDILVVAQGEQRTQELTALGIVGIDFQWQ